MADTPDTPKRDWRDTVFLPKTDFPMKAGLAQKEPAILAKWKADGLYRKLRSERAGKPRFILHDGPPYANGDIHMGHAMNKVLKDIIVRSQTLMGKDAPYVPGWDCHGLPIEWKVEEQYRAKKLNKDEVPIAQFRAECRAYAAKWVAVQREQFERLGVMGDWDDPYLTMDYAAEAAIVAELLKFAESGQLYRGAKPVMWSPVEKTALAEAEVEYEDIVSTQIDVAFEIVDSPIKELIGAHAVVWTTTPWTIPVNQAIAYGPEVEYALVTLNLHAHKRGDFKEGKPLATYDGRKVLIADLLIMQFLDRWRKELERADDGVSEHVFLPAAEWETLKGADLAGTFARHPMANRFSPLPFRGGAGGGAYAPDASLDHSPHPNPSPEGEGPSPLAEFFAKPRPFLPGDFVTTDAGTGLVHMAPDHGEDDFLLCKARGIDPVFAVEGDGKYRADWAWLGGQGSVINARFNAPDGPICSDLRAAGALLAASADYKHSYPHSWRSKAKVIFRATPQWFIAMDRAFEPVSTSLDPAGFDERDSAVPSEVEGPSNQQTLRQTALASIAETRWVPTRAENRITAMVEGRPDWVISRQRAWGVPIALYVDRKSGGYLIDKQVNRRIVEAFRQGGADAWFTADHQAILGHDYAAADYEPVTDILDVWFDSGSTHAFVVEARYGVGARADLYLEGSDQHRGWFQSSLLESCGTRGRAPYDAVLTHGFALDSQGRKMSKSVGNVVDPLKVIGESGADILRLWVASTDYFEDVRIGRETLGTTSDTYRKLRNTFRYLLGALEGFGEQEKTDLADAAVPELERYILHLLARLDTELREAADAFEFTRYASLIAAFATNDLSAFYFDVRKDSLYCDAPSDPKRRAYRTVLDIVFNALVRWLAPILCFTTEEVWNSRSTNDLSVHALTWPEVDSAWIDKVLAEKWTGLRGLRAAITESIEPMRRDKVLGSSLEARVRLHVADEEMRAAIESVDFAELCIVTDLTVDAAAPDAADIAKTDWHKCGRCWRHLPEVVEDGDLCGRCAEVAA